MFSLSKVRIIEVRIMGSAWKVGKNAAERRVVRPLRKRLPRYNFQAEIDPFGGEG